MRCFFISPPHLFWDVREKWQFWTIAAANTNLYGGVPLLVISTSAESMFERHSTEHYQSSATPTPGK